MQTLIGNNQSTTPQSARTKTGAGSAAAKTPLSTSKLNPNTAKLLEDVFRAYCGASAGSSVNNLLLDYQGWTAFCQECKLVEGSTPTEYLNSLFFDVTLGAPNTGAMSFECFTAALSLVAEAKYGATDSIARLVYFKIIRFGRSAKSAAIHHASASGASGEASGVARNHHKTPCNTTLLDSDRLYYFTSC